MKEWEISRSGGGNWDDKVIEDVTARLGCKLSVSSKALKGIKRVVRDDKGALALVRDLRNKLAHGALSFSECGDGVTLSELREIKERTTLYLKEVVAAFHAYIDGHMFLEASSRPGGSDSQ